MDNQDYLSKKIIFLYPPSVIRDEMIKILIGYEYEIYFVFDHNKLKHFMKKYKDLILFINIDEILTEPDWEKYIRELMTSPEYNRVSIGILTYNNNSDLQKKYLMEMMIPSGYIKLSVGIRESTKILIKMLEANEVRGRRKHVRATCNRQSSITSFNIRLGDKFYQGKIRDISTAGMACSFDQIVEIPLRTYITDIQLKLKGVLCNVSGIVGALREGNDPVYVILFEQNMSNGTKLKIASFIFKQLQESVLEELASIRV